jgi:hypothetical protein
MALSKRNASHPFQGALNQLMVLRWSSTTGYYLGSPAGCKTGSHSPKPGPLGKPSLLAPFRRLSIPTVLGQFSQKIV